MKFSRQLESMETISQGYFPERLPCPSAVRKIIFLNLLPSAGTIARGEILRNGIKNSTEDVTEEKENILVGG